MLTRESDAMATLRMREETATATDRQICTASKFVQSSVRPRTLNVSVLRIQVSCWPFAPQYRYNEVGFAPLELFWMPMSSEQQRRNAPAAPLTLWDALSPLGH